ncbi:Histone-lysine N-methyltransferase H3 lysine-9 specific SUVH5 [Euphorbia peplus]|nr:Histone-lysine N-methyltransferase H3 lysine-9 specific SUVH5 [Euphorbia peplus]
MVRNSNSHIVKEISPRLPVKRDFRDRRGGRYRPYQETDTFSDGNSKKDRSRYRNEETGVMKNKINTILGIYHKILENVLRENNKLICKRASPYQHAASLLSKRGISFLNVEKRIGSVPGVEIGDEFESRAELVIVGLHHQYTRGIDYMKIDGTTKLATSVVSSDRYDNSVNSSGEMIYTGEGGGNPMVSSYARCKDQVLTQGNLALWNSMERGTPIRVIRKCTLQRKKFFVYDGLHLVEKCRSERDPLYNKIVFKFHFRRILDQPKNPRGLPSFKSRKPFLHEQGVIMEDLSRGKEKLPIVVINTIDDTRPPKFTYTANVGFPTDNSHIGCDCDDGCSDSEDCACLVKNGRKLGYDYSECLVRKRPFIFECGPSCKCFDSCINKVSQRGIRFQMEVFKTEGKGWGLRSRKHIPSGSFVCEYVGEMLNLKKVYQKDIPDNEYLFSMGKDNDVLTIDASRQGNVGRFINHSCSPNLHVQNVYIGPRAKAPHKMLFAMKDIEPFEELTFDYNLRLGGKDRKEKNCKCGSVNCLGKFY